MKALFLSFFDPWGAGDAKGESGSGGRSWLTRLWRNGFFVLSAAAFYSLSMMRLGNLRMAVYIAILLAVLANAAVAACVGSFYRTLRRCPAWVLCLAAMGAVAICLVNREQSLALWTRANLLIGIARKLGLSIELFSALGSSAFAALSCWYVFVFLSLFYRWFSTTLRQSGFSLARFERVTLAVLFVVVGVYTIVAFCQSNAFYVCGSDSDVIYTSDSNSIVINNAYMCIDHSENDIRQPLFAVFAMPMVAPLYLLSYALPFVPNAAAILLNLAQIAMLVFGVLLLAKLADVSPAAEVALMVAFLSTYTGLLFTVMMEQYIVSFFWIALLLYNNRRLPSERMLPLLGSCGTLLTSAMLVPCSFIGEKQGGKQTARLFAQTLLIGAFLVLLFGKLTIVEWRGIQILNGYRGEEVPMLAKWLQYTAYVAGCFVASPSFATLNTWGYPSWQLMPVTQINPLGVTLIALSLVSLVVNRRDWLCRACGYWVGCSFVVLCLIGWGTAENGLILYSLYYGWAFFLLLFKLAQWALDKLKLSKWLPALCALATGAMLWYNIPKHAEMLRFLAQKYPA